MLGLTAFSNDETAVLTGISSNTASLELNEEGTATLEFTVTLSFFVIYLVG